MNWNKVQDKEKSTQYSNKSRRTKQLIFTVQWSGLHGIKVGSWSLHRCMFKVI